MLNLKKTYPSKLLLFGEYTVTKGSSALAVPLQNNYAQWQISTSLTQNQSGLYDLLKYLSQTDRGQETIDILQLETALKNGWFLDSNIPQGYGLGSSGSVVAAVYDAFCSYKTNDLILLKKQLSFIENAFHGNSSGIDPMVSYLNSGLLITKSGIIEQIQLDTKQFSFFMIDTGVSRKTTPLVNLFEKKLKNNTDFESQAIELMKLNDKAVEHTTKGNKNELWRSMCHISDLHFNYFHEMILPEWSALWSKGLTSQEFALKICGAGGGGMILGMYNPHLKNKDIFKNTRIIEL